MRLTKRDFESMTRFEATIRGSHLFCDVPLKEGLIFAIQNDKLLSIFRRLPRSIPLHYYKQKFLVLSDDDLKWLWEDFSVIFPDEKYVFIVMRKSEINLQSTTKTKQHWHSEEALSPALPYKSQKYYREIKRINPYVDDDTLRYAAYQWSHGALDKMSAYSLLKHQDPLRGHV